MSDERYYVSAFSPEECTTRLEDSAKRISEEANEDGEIAVELHGDYFLLHRPLIGRYEIEGELCQIEQGTEIWCRVKRGAFERFFGIAWFSQLGIVTLLLIWRTLDPLDPNEVDLLTNLFAFVVIVLMTIVGWWWMRWEAEKRKEDQGALTTFVAEALHAVKADHKVR